MSALFFTGMIDFMFQRAIIIFLLAALLSPSSWAQPGGQRAAPGVVVS